MSYARFFALGAVLSIASACGNEGPADGDVGSLHAAIELSSVSHDVTALQMNIVALDQDCNATPLDSRVVQLQAEALSTALADSGTHPFADALFVLEPGAYRICATPLAGDTPSAECSATESTAEVASGETSEVVLYAQCSADGKGALDVLVALNDQPEVTALQIDPSKFITQCETATLTAQASDPNDDSLTYSWIISAGSTDAHLNADGPSATFSGPAGDYGVDLVVTDGHGGEATLNFPIHVAEAVCEAPAAVQAIFTSRCGPCHISGSSGGLRIDSAEASFANMVAVGSSAAACADRVRVVPGDSATSYVMAKLRGSAGICGTPMPRNSPPLPAAELALIEAWIDALPH